MSIHKPPVVKHPVSFQKGSSKKIVYRVIRNIQQIKNNQPVGTARINKQTYMVKKSGIGWVVV
ncbi:MULTISPECIES: hypothetical protein [Nostocales]|uniref:hypothetical protein n=1 Tax=Nostocales TaxID=1161 RepID=UPI0016894395|nr:MULTISPECIES: hypothetical protein [Nostocales]MBD2303894.1 hypothetical protein [Nostoc sp. FACHB-190]MBD2492163.1 hypothetical protein [Aulosira sp. FACHB-615]